MSKKPFALESGDLVFQLPSTDGGFDISFKLGKENSVSDGEVVLTPRDLASVQLWIARQLRICAEAGIDFSGIDYDCARDGHSFKDDELTCAVCSFSPSCYGSPAGHRCSDVGDFCGFCGIKMTPIAEDEVPLKSHEDFRREARDAFLDYP